MTTTIEKQVGHVAAQQGKDDETPPVIDKSWGRVTVSELAYAMHPDLGNGDEHDFRLMDALDTSRTASDVAAQLRRVADVLDNRK